MAATPNDVDRLKNQLLSLNLDSDSDLLIYRQLREDFIIANEGCSLWAYNDMHPDWHPITNPKSNGYITVGIGFNMDRADSLTEWMAALAPIVDIPLTPFFNDVKQQRKPITMTQAKALLHANLEVREELIRREYRTTYTRLKLNERLAILDAYFNCPRLVNNRSRFKRHITNYVEHGDVESLKSAIFEIEFKSNPKNNKGIANRRNAQALLLKGVE